ncbi:ABC transporter substrate-binding protein [Microbacterium lushaniae]|uniref:ABC transporter substrate-binding protein n=1 Tax=Microbacterium lushaniae TaxID=2614639 RepID=A0A5J6L0E4_9MICO|nr:ABC transporter substrate-binding protein [Microbacterium lushaniae]QEW01941.1 ABC transporter substrate-binding protein [Microbacterium lushaniae]
MKRASAPRAAVGTVGILAVAAFALAACSAPETSGEDSDAPQSLVIGVTADVDTLLPWTSTQFQATHVLQNLYGTLTEFDDDLAVTEGLAESWETSEDGLTVTFQLREGVTFADGSELDAEDVVASYQAIKDEATAAVSASNLASVETIEAVDPLTVQLTLSAPDAALFSKLGVITTAILPSDVDLEAVETEPNGTGAFVFEDRKPNQSLTLAANPEYWGGEPEVDTVEFRVIPDQSAIVSALQAGSVQMAVFDDQLVADTIGGSVEVTETPQLSYHVLQINSRVAPLDDVNVRLAIACAIDRQEVLDTAALGAGEVTGPITSPAFRSDPDARPCPEGDVDAAKDYLADAGYEDGLTLRAIVNQDGYSTAVAEAENIQAQLKNAGITLEIESLESGAYVDRWVAADFELAVALNGGQPDPDASYGRYFTSAGSLNPVAGYSSETLDALFAEGKAESDDAARKAIYDQVAAELEDNAAWVWLFTSFNYTATAEGVSGFVPLSNGSLQNLRDVTVD